MTEIVNIELWNKMVRKEERERIKVVINAFRTKNSGIIGTKIYDDILNAIDPK